MITNIYAKTAIHSKANCCSWEHWFKCDWSANLMWLAACKNNVVVFFKGTKKLFHCEWEKLHGLQWQVMQPNAHSFWLIIVSPSVGYLMVMTLKHTSNDSGWYIEQRLGYLSTFFSYIFSYSVNLMPSPILPLLWLFAINAFFKQKKNSWRKFLKKKLFSSLFLSC